MSRKSGVFYRSDDTLSVSDMTIEGTEMGLIKLWEKIVDNIYHFFFATVILDKVTFSKLES